MIKIVAETGRFLYPQDLLKKAAATYYPNIDWELHCEPFYAPGEAHWAFDNYRARGGGHFEEATYLFFTQPGWASFFESQLPREKLKCVTYAIDPDYHHPVDVDKEYDVGFIGEFTSPDQWRQQYLSALKQNFKCLFSSETKTESISTELSKCKVLFNHIRTEEVNIRFYEAMAIGPQLCSHTSSLHYLAPSNAYMDFTGVEDCISKVKKLLASKTLREEIAGRGQEFVKNQTYKHRLEEMLQLVGKI